MPLLDLWAGTPSAVAQFTIEQVVSAAGDGKLRDGSVCSDELRHYLAQVQSEQLASYIDQCLDGSFGRSGMVLQDLVNELGRRLDFDVRNGLYQGRSGAVGFDGIWLSAEGHALVVEVKTTDAYRIALDTLARYRRQLLQTGNITEPSSVLIVVGREDTGELEAQVRGSRHAWDIRLISTDALVKLVRLKEGTEERETATKIRSLLAPMEYTKLDAMVDIMFTTARDVETAAETESTSPVSGEADEASVRSVWHFTDSGMLQDKRLVIIEALGRRLSTSLVKKSRALYWNADHRLRVACTVSKRYERGPTQRYWYAYHPAWDAFLAEGESGYLALGCMDLNQAFVVPRATLLQQLPYLNTTLPENGPAYWHVVIGETAGGRYYLQLPKSNSSLPLDEFVLALPDR